MKIKTSLLSGAGNTFHIIHDTAAAGVSLDVSVRKRIAKKICERTTADGLIFLSQKNSNKLNWMFYNNDGSDAEMCGNATRCVGYFAKNILHDSNSEWILNTVAGEIAIKALAKEMFEVVMTPIEEYKSELGFFCNTGVPHLVLPIQDLKQVQQHKMSAKNLRNNDLFKPSGTNVTFIQMTKVPQTIQAISYERGVEDFTRACGTGAMAAAYYNLKNFGVAESHVEMPGGMLIMNLTNLQKPKMTGPAVLIGNYDYEI